MLNPSFKFCVAMTLTIALGGCSGGGDGGSSSGGGGSSDENTTPATPVENFTFNIDNSVTEETTEFFVTQIKNEVGSSITVLNEIPNFFDNNQVPILYKMCGFENAYYSPAERGITFCHELGELAYSLFRENALNAEFSEQDAHSYGFNNAIRMTDFVIFHEIGHALDDIRDDIGIGGNFESVADAIAVVLSVQTGQPNNAVSGAYFFNNLPSTNSLFDEHGNNADRTGDIMCWVTGSSSNAAAAFPNWVAGFNQSGRDCVGEYQSQLQFVTDILPGLGSVRPVASIRAKSHTSTVNVEFLYRSVEGMASGYFSAN